MCQNRCSDFFLLIIVCSVGKKPASVLSNYDLLTDDLLALNDGFVKNTFLLIV